MSDIWSTLLHPIYQQLQILPNINSWSTFIYRQLEILEYINSGSYNILSLDPSGCIQFIDHEKSYNIIMPVNLFGCIQFIDHEKYYNTIMPVNLLGCIQFIDN